MDDSVSPRQVIVPTSLVPSILAAVHGLAHPAANATLREVSKSYVWTGMRRSVKDFCRACLPCQPAKVVRHVRTPLQPLKTPGERFSSLNLDLVGPLPSADGFTYLLTVVDHFTRWPEAIPLSDITALTCAKALLQHWVSRYGVPLHLVTDQGRQFTSNLWRHLMHILGTKHSMTTSYHPQANGLVERFHQTLKERLMARSQAAGAGTWLDHLPFVLLGLRSAVREDSACCPADLVYGSTVRLPADFLDQSPSPRPPSTASDYVETLRDIIRSSAPMPFLYHKTPSSQVPVALRTCSHVFVRIDAVRRPLSPPYEGPFRVLLKNDKTFQVERLGKPFTVSVDRLKPSFSPDFSLACDPSQTPAPATTCSAPLPLIPAPATTPTVTPTVASPSRRSAPPPAASPSSRLDPDSWPLPTRYGRRPRPVDRLGIGVVGR